MKEERFVLDRKMGPYPPTERETSPALKITGSRWAKFGHSSSSCWVVM